MTNKTSHSPDANRYPFADPVAYLASFGIDSELVATTVSPAGSPPDTPLPAAA